MFENNKMVIPKIVAEIGCNHKGSIAIAKEMITTAKMFCCLLYTSDAADD